MSGPPEKLKRKYRILGYFTEVEKFRINLAIKQHKIGSYSEFIRQSSFFYIRFLDLLKNKDLDMNSDKLTSLQQNNEQNSKDGEMKDLMKLVINELKDRFESGTLFG